jgi:HSP20 family molecular chaperone IbpA
MSVDDTLWVGTDAGSFAEGNIEIWVAPRRLTICGKARVGKEGAAKQGSRSCTDKDVIFHVLDLTREVNPSLVTAKIEGSSLELFLRKAAAGLEPVRDVKAAVA